MTQEINGINPIDRPILQEGATGEAVKKLQQLLNSYGTYSGDIDGVFGFETTGGVILFQYRFFLQETGIVNSKTWQVLYKCCPVDMPILNRGSQGKLVVALQQRLRIAGKYTDVFDGNFGPVTEAAVKSFQHQYNLPADGIVRDRTWFALSNLNEFSC
jgi:peptidoglycan hydrolase-like protein with peptidoglycan-binding domain